MPGFMFASGIENSYPVIRLPSGERFRVDEMAKTRHYACWKEDFQLAKSLGVDFLRYWPPYYSTHTGPGTYDWSFADETFNELRAVGITPIADLCHFGVPDWVGEGFQNPDWPEYFAEYAAAFAHRYPWVRLFTPVNEIFVAATFSALYGWWNERLTSDRGFVTALRNLCRANVRAMQEIVKVCQRPTFIQSESSEYFHPEEPSCIRQSEFLNERRFLSLDLTYSHPLSVPVHEYLLEHGMTRADQRWFEENRVKALCIMGTDYYVTNEHLVRADGTTHPSGEIFGYYVLTRQYYRRYRLPVMHTETNIAEPDAVPWLWKEWANMVRLRQDGIPVMGFTWYSLTDQVDWDTALREDNERVNPLGLCDLDRNLRPVGKAYRKLISQWRDMLPTESVVLALGY